MFPTFEQSGHQYGAQLMYVCLSPVGGTTLLFMTPEWFKCQDRTRALGGLNAYSKVPRSHIGWPTEQ